MSPRNNILMKCNSTLSFYSQILYVYVIVCGSIKMQVVMAVGFLPSVRPWPLR